MGCDNAGIPETGEDIDILIKKKGTILLISNFGTYWDRRPAVKQLQPHRVKMLSESMKLSKTLQAVIFKAESSEPGVISRHTSG